jgi:hypothetical protein
VPAPRPVVAAVRGGGSEAPLRRRRGPDSAKVAWANDSCGSSGTSQTRCEPSSRFRDDPAAPTAALCAAQPSSFGARLVRWKRVVQVPGARRCLTFELRGRNRRGAWPAKRSIDHERFAGQVPGRWRSRSSEGLGVALSFEPRISAIPST